MFEFVCFAIHDSSNFFITGRLPKFYETKGGQDLIFVLGEECFHGAQ